MNVKKLIIIILIQFSSNLLFAQKEFTKWYFGDKAAIDFVSGSAVVLNNSKINGLDNTCSMADSAGNLLFYFDGQNVYNKNHNTMSNGTAMGTDVSSGHVAVCIRQPGTGKIYYIFTVEGYAKSNGLNYSIVDMSKNGGLGDVISKKNNLHTPTTEKIILAKHANKKDIWIITHKWNSDEWVCYQLSKSGVGNPVSTNIGSSLSNGSTENAIGNMDINLDYNIIASALYNLGKMELFKFDNSTGKLSNNISLTGIYRSWGVQFSPDGKKLYLTQWTTENLWQYDLSSYSKTDIENSKTDIGPCTGPDAGYKAGYMMLAPDNKIYIGKYLSSYLGVINDPNASGKSCNFVDNGINISPGKSSVGLPNKTFGIHDCTINKPYLGRDTSLCKGSQVILKDTTKNVSSYLWSDASKNSTLAVTAEGQYWVEIANGNCKQRDTINVSIKNPPNVNLGNDTAICATGNFILDAKLSGLTYKWNTNQTTQKITVNTPGKYWVNVTQNGCTGSDTIILSLNNLPKPNLGKDTFACEGTTISINGFTNNAKTYSWNTGNKIPQQDVIVSGTYILMVGDNKCFQSDTIVVTFIPYSIVKLGRDTGFCGNFSLPLNAGNPGLNKIWNTGQTTSAIIASIHQLYWVEVSNQGCKKRDTIIINKLSGPNVNLGNDSNYCSSVSRILDAKNVGMTYLWNDNSTNQTLTVKNSGKYWVEVKDAFGCIVTDTIKLMDLSFTFNLGNDTSVCYGEKVNLNTKLISYKNLWSTGDTNSLLQVSKSGYYKCTVNNGYCKSTDSILVVIWPAINLNLGPDTTICEDLEESIILVSPTGFLSYKWQPNGEITNNIFVKLPGNYSLTVKDSKNCSDTDFISITKLCPVSFWVPTAFNPSSESTNARFGIVYRGPPVEGYEMLIFNRWGELLFKSDNIDEYWDGIYKDKPCQLGMYLCIIHFTAKFGNDKKRSSYKGMFYLNR